MIKVGFDISQTAHFGGVATYTKNLAEQLATFPDLQMVYPYFSLRKPYSGSLQNVKKIPLPPSLFEILFNKIRFIPIEQFIGEVDVFHSSDWVQPKTKAKKVTTYHDVIPLKYPEWSKSKIVEVHKKRLELVEKEIDLVIAVSETTKRDLLEVSSIPEDKIIVIYEGVDKKYGLQDESGVEEFRRKYNLPDKFVLAVGGIGNRRNLERAKEAVSGYNLVVTGETIPWISDEEMPLLYSSAEVLLYPSLYEGFGLPVLEAMATGTPVITSNVSALPEVGGDAAAYINPEDTEGMAKAIREIMEDKGAREMMIKKGLEQAKKFSWEKCALETVGVYRNLTTNH